MTDLGASVAETQAILDGSLEWIHQAGNPYFDWFFGSPDAARAALERWMRRPTSEVSATHIVPLWTGGRVVGGYIALSGDAVAACRRADVLAVIRESSSAQRRELAARMDVAKRVFDPVEPDVLYLSKIGVVPTSQRQGHGRRLLDSYLSAGRRAGYRRFRLDVAASNASVVALYESVGFRRVTASRDRIGSTIYLAMACDD